MTTPWNALTVWCSKDIRGNGNQLNISSRAIEAEKPTHHQSVIWKCVFSAHPINIGEICCSNEVQGWKAEEWLKGCVWNESGEWNLDHVAWILPAARDGSCLTSCNGHLALRPSEQIEWQERRRSRLPVVWREQDVNKKQRFLSSFQIGKGISCRQLVAPALEYILRWRMNIYCDGGWIYTAMADEYILRWQMKIYCDLGWIYIRLFQGGNLFIYSGLHKFWK